MDVNAFYQTVATFCFTLLGLWWGVLQLRHDDWMWGRNRRGSRHESVRVFADGW